MVSKKRVKRQRPSIHPRSRYAEVSPDFSHLASLYPVFKPHVFYAANGRPLIDWTDFNATRELTRVLLHHDHNVNWWIPDGHLCPTVPNRLNYILWIEDLLSSTLIPKISPSEAPVRGFDIGTGANCIYPLLGASLLDWSFVASDTTDVALEWAKKNVDCNPHLSHLIEIRNAEDAGYETKIQTEAADTDSIKQTPNGDEEDSYHGPPVLLGVVKEGELYDFCMCNPPFFRSITEAGLNPKTSCGGTFEELVCPGGECAFITRIIEDSVKLNNSFRWYTSLVGRKINLKVLVSRLRKVGVSVVKTTEFVQGYTCRWGLAWSFLHPVKKPSLVAQKSHCTFLLEGLRRQGSAIDVLNSVELLFVSAGASCKSNLSCFRLDIIASAEQCDVFLKHCCDICTSDLICDAGWKSHVSESCDMRFSISVFEQSPGTLLVRGSLLQGKNIRGVIFSCIFERLEELLRKKLDNCHNR